MATVAQSVANQANAQHSTGPRTAAGKARVSHNAIRHGLTARHLVVRDDEREEFAAFQDSLLAEIDPQGAIETVTFHELLHAAWNLQRFRRIEAELAASGDPFSDPQTAATADRLARYQARTQRAYYRAIHELRTLQTNRALRAVKLDQDIAAEVPAITGINELTKQTHSEVTAEALTLAIQMVDYEAKTLLRNLPRENRLQARVGSAPLAPSETTPAEVAR